MEGLERSAESQRKEDGKHTDILCSPFYTLHITCYILLCLAFIVIPSNGLSRERTLDYVIAVVNDQPITLRELETELIIIAVINNPLILREQENQPTFQEIKNPPNAVRRAVLETLIEQKLMLQQADDIGMLLRSWGKKVDAEIQALKSLYSSEASYLVDLKRMGLEYQEVEERVKNALIVNELTVRQFRNSIDEEQINQEAPQYFEQHRSDFIEPPQIQFQYILVLSKSDDPADLQAEAKTLAEKIASQLKRGATFQEIQEAYPDNPFLRVVPEPQTLPADTKVQLAIAILEINEVSQPIPTTEGYLIAQLLKKQPSRQKTYPEASQEIKDKLIGEALQDHRKTWLAEQKVTADIRILDTELAKTPLVLSSVTEGPD
ncbi:SurA N-terminal domain-containing protein [Candidatus Poribacteria bacterium]|nr:SurA N-terminal domain-containing protein [Candidatus Poribacteria bacterium]